MNINIIIGTQCRVNVKISHMSNDDQIANKFDSYVLRITCILKAINVPLASNLILKLPM